MSGRVVGYTPPNPIHVCDPPSVTRSVDLYPQGTVWQCDGCDKTYVVTFVTVTGRGDDRHAMLSWNSEGWWPARRRRKHATP